MKERLATLLKKIALHRIRISDSKAFGQNIGKNHKSRVVNVLALVHGPNNANFYTKEHKAYLTGANRPVVTEGDNYRHWMDTLWKICVSTELKFIYHLVQEFNSCVPAYNDLIGKDAKNKPQTRSFNAGKEIPEIKGKTLQKKDVGSVASAVEKLKTMKKALTMKK